MKTKALSLAVLGTLVLLPGCVFSLGGSNRVTSTEKERLQQLEQRIETMEGKLGIEHKGGDE
jgi:hypothetical protein